MNVPNKKKIDACTFKANGEGDKLSKESQTQSSRVQIVRRHCSLKLKYSILNDKESSTGLGQVLATIALDGVHALIIIVMLES